ncbi:MAG: SET domain-containing protein [Luteolibacter sp.]
MIHPSTELRLVNPHVGYGVFASKAIPTGTLVFVQDPLDIVISPEQYQALNEISRQHAEKYSYLDARGYRILSWDGAKYVNHSCAPNTMSTGWGFEVAIRDIAAGEEITDEYGLFNLEWEMDCCCGHSSCRSRIRPGDAIEYARRWDKQLRRALQHVPMVEQPLLAQLDEVSHHSLQQYLNGTKRYRSVRHLLLKRAAADGNVAC